MDINNNPVTPAATDQYGNAIVPGPNVRCRRTSKNEYSIEATTAQGTAIGVGSRVMNPRLAAGWR